MTTILTVVQDFCYELGITPVPSTLISPGDNTGKQLLRILYTVHRRLRSARCWTQQKRTYSFSTSNGVTKYPLPQDYFSALLDTEWNQSTSLRLLGPRTDSQFTDRTKGGDGGDLYDFRIFGPDINPNSAGGQFEVFPAPGSSAQTLYFEYISRNLFLPKNWATSTAYTSGTYVNANGNIYLCDTNGTSGASASSAPSTTAQNISDNTTRWDYVSTPYETVIADTDLSLWDDDLVNLGLKAHWKWTKGFNWEKAEVDFNAIIGEASTRSRGGFRGSFSRTSNGPRYKPSTPGSWNI